METWDNDDYETPIEEYPGYLGHTWDGELYVGPHLTMLSEFDWSSYMDLLDGEGGRSIKISLPSGTTIIEIEAYDDPALIVDQLPSIKVLRDAGNPDGGPASGAGYIFFLAEDSSLEILASEISALVENLKTDLKGEAQDGDVHLVAG
jgi:hypothetical protein